MIVGCYTLDLYCDQPHNINDYNGISGVAAANFQGSTRMDCIRQARKSGWIFHNNGLISCPACAKSHKGVPTTPYLEHQFDKRTGNVV